MSAIIAPSLGRICEPLRTRKAQRFDAGAGCRMTVSEIARATGCTVSSIYARIETGDTGPARQDGRMSAVLPRSHKATGRAIGRPPGANLHRDGYAGAAAWIAARLASTRGPMACSVRSDGGIWLRERAKLAPDSYAEIASSSGYIGTYNRAAQIEHIEDDLLHWMRAAV